MKSEKEEIESKTSAYSRLIVMIIERFWGRFSKIGETVFGMVHSLQVNVPKKRKKLKKNQKLFTQVWLHVFAALQIPRGEDARI